MKFLIALFAMSAVFALAAAAPNHSPYGPILYGGGSTTAWSGFDAINGLNNNNIIRGGPWYGGYASVSGGLVPGYPWY